MNQKLKIGNGNTLIEVVRYKNKYYVLLNDISDKPYVKKDYGKNNKEKIENSNVTLEVETLDGLQVIIDSLNKIQSYHAIATNYYEHKNVININEKNRR